MKKLIITAIAGVVIGAGALPAQAQMDWLTPHLDAQRFGNPLKQNQRMAEKRKQKAKRTVTVRPTKVQDNRRPLPGTVPAVKKANGIPGTLKTFEIPFVHKGGTKLPLHLVEAGLGEPAKPAPPRNNNRLKLLSW